MITKEVLKWIGLAVLVVIVAGIVYLAVIWRKPLGEPLPTPVPTSAESATIAAPTSTDAPTASPTEVPPTATPTPRPVCSGPPSMLILAVGIDYRNPSYLYGLADVIRIIKADFVNVQLYALDIPRAIQVEIPDIGAHGIYNGVLNQAYFWGTEGMGYYDGPGFGAGLLARTLEVNFGLNVDHYVVTNMSTVSRAIDDIGGVPIYVYDTIDDRTRPGLPAIELYGYFSAGNHWLSGTEAVRYARIRSIGGIFGRHDRQNELLVQLYNRVMTPSIVSRIPDLIETFYGSILTDLSLEQISQLACLGLKLDLDDIHFESMPSELFVEGYNQRGDSALFADMNVLTDLITEFVEGPTDQTTE
jgi:LCP family protein required for cell wall assembly